MMRSVKQLHRYKLGGLDGDIGHVKGFYFDDKDWVIRYLVADTGSWIPGRKALISPYALGVVYPGGKLLEVKLSRQKVQDSPSINTDLPVVRQQEADYYRYYNWPVYWGGPGIWGLGSTPAPRPSFQSAMDMQDSASPATEANSHLRSTQEIIGYTVQGLEGEIGHVEDFLLDDRNWAIRFLVVTTGPWWSGKNVSVPAQSIGRVSWEEARILAKLTRAAMQQESDYEYAGRGDPSPNPFK